MARWAWTLLKLAFALLLAIAGFLLPPELHWWWSGAGDVEKGDAPHRTSATHGARRKPRPRAA